MGPRVDLIHFLTEMIDLRSFSNLWYWIGLAVLWSSASHWVLGVPFDLIARAGRQEGQARNDLDIAVGVQVRRAVHIADTAGNFLTAFVFFVLTVLVLLGFVYAVEFAQAVFLMACPMSLVGALNMRAARQIVSKDLAGDASRKVLLRTRLKVQVLGAVSIFVTACWGMYQNLVTGVF